MKTMAGRRTPRAPALVRGSVVTHRRRCGKANCRCTNGTDLHESIVLSYSDAGRTKFLMLPAEHVATVRAAVDAYHAAKAQLEEQGNAGLAELTARLASTSAGRRR